MINVDVLFRRVQDMSRQYRSGFMSNDEFNDGLLMAQEVVAMYYYSKFEESNIVSDTLFPFIKSESISVVGGIMPIPSDFKFKLEANVTSINNTDVGIDEMVEPIRYINSDHWSGTLSSPIRKPRIGVCDSYGMTRKNNNFHVRPLEITKAQLTYIRNPNVATRVVTFDSDTDEETYDANASINLEWGQHCLPLFVDLLLSYKGVQLSDSQIIDYKINDYVKSKNLQGD